MNRFLAHSLLEKAAMIEIRTTIGLYRSISVYIQCSKFKPFYMYRL